MVKFVTDFEEKSNDLTLKYQGVLTFTGMFFIWYPRPSSSTNTKDVGLNFPKPGVGNVKACDSEAGINAGLKLLWVQSFESKAISN